MSSISINFNNLEGLFYKDINNNFPTTLDSISTGWYNSNVSLNIYRDAIAATVSNAPNYIDGGSSISTLYEGISSIVFNYYLNPPFSLNNAINYGSTLSWDISSVSTLYAYINFTIDDALNYANYAAFNTSSVSTLYSDIINGSSLTYALDYGTSNGWDPLSVSTLYADINFTIDDALNYANYAAFDQSLVSTLYSDIVTITSSPFTFENALTYASGFGDAVSTISSFVISTINNTLVNNTTVPQAVTYTITPTLSRTRLLPQCI
jgi:hypothetical protein